MLNGAPGPVDIVLGGSRQGGDFRFFKFSGNLGYRIKISFGGGRKSGFQYIDAELFQLRGQSKLFRGVHTGPGRLLAVS